MNIRPITTEDWLSLVLEDTKETQEDDHRTHNLVAQFTSDVGPLTLRFMDNGLYESTTYKHYFSGTEAQFREWLREEDINLLTFVGYDEVLK